MEKQVVAGFVEEKWDEEDAWFAAAVDDDPTMATADAATSEAGSVKEEQEEEEEEAAVLPGFRFHPTDEELIGFYLRRKVEKRPLSREIIKVVDIYKYEPWELPKVSANVGTADMEWYFYCRRGRKYRNSVRPNRVTGRGFWKATGVDKPIFSTTGGKGKSKVGGKATSSCLGLKKSLVYYIGSAGKGTKTDWMMHEFRLPPTGGGKKDGSDDNFDYNSNNGNSVMDQSSIPEAEVWTICRIFKRSLPHKKQQPQSRGDRRSMVQAASVRYTEYSEIQAPAQDMCGQWYSSPDSSFEVEVDDSDDGDASTTFPAAPLGQYYDSKGYAVQWLQEEHQHHDQRHGQQYQYQHHYAHQQNLVPYARGHNGHLHQQSWSWTDSANADAGGPLTSEPTATGVPPEKGLTNHGFSGVATAGASCFVSNNDILKDWTWEDISRMVSPGP